MKEPQSKQLLVCKKKPLYTHQIKSTIIHSRNLRQYIFWDTFWKRIFGELLNHISLPKYLRIPIRIAHLQIQHKSSKIIRKLFQPHIHKLSYIFLNLRELISWDNGFVVKKYFELLENIMTFITNLNIMCCPGVCMLEMWRKKCIFIFNSMILWLISLSIVEKIYDFVCW